LGIVELDGWIESVYGLVGLNVKESGEWIDRMNRYLNMNRMIDEYDSMVFRTANIKDID